MGILNKLTSTGSTLSRGNGVTPSVSDLKASLVHNTYSITGTPNLPKYPKPSSLDLDGKTPEKYIDKIKK